MKLRSSLLGAALLLGTLPAVAGPAAPACAAEGLHAALVVDTGPDLYRLCVALPAQEVSGLRLIQLAGEQYGLDYRFDGGAVCRLAGVGPEGGDCFGKYPEFWGYWRGDGSGGWTWSGSGAASTEVSDGDVEGWSWGKGSDGSSHPRPPETTFQGVCGYSPQPSATPTEESRGEEPDDAPEDEEEASAGGGGGNEGNPGGGARRPRRGPRPGVTGGDEPRTVSAPETGGRSGPSGGDEVVEGRGRDRKHQPDRRQGGGKARVGSAIPEVDGAPTPPQQAALPESAQAKDEGVSLAGVAGMGIAILLVGAGAWLSRRRMKVR